MYRPKKHEALNHKFVTCNELITLYRNLRGCRYFPHSKRGTLEMGCKILNEGNTRFPENQMYYDMGNKSVGLVFAELLLIEHCNFNAMLPEAKLGFKTNFDKTVSGLYQLLGSRTADPTKGLYDRESFEAQFGLVWDEEGDTSE